MLAPMFESMRSFWLAMARATDGGSALELPGVWAAVVPALPGRSVVNCVVYEDAPALEAALPDLAEAYDGAGVRAWTVWVHESDADTQSALAAAGHVLDAAPMGQELELDRVERPADADLELASDPTTADWDPIVAASYGWPGFAAAVPAFPHGFHPYMALHDGSAAACLGIWDHGDDAHVQLVATAPEARRRGLASRLLLHALADARDRGCTISRLQATAMGQPVYARLGYRDVGRVQMWERRKPASRE